MSAQIIELLIFAGIAFFIINRLIATLGSTSEEDPANKASSSFFGESGIKDVTYSAKNTTSNILKKGLLNIVKTPSKLASIQELIIEENSSDIIAGLESITAKLPSFEAKKFLRSAKMAFELIIVAVNNDSTEDLEKLVDKRYLQQFQIFSVDYGQFIDASKVNAKISEAYSFANNIFIKVLFTGKSITSKMDSLKEEWTFSRSLISKNIDWLLTNITKEEEAEQVF
jgi:predicted lipid-binding transport protein (Tim44 family)